MLSRVFSSSLKGIEAYPVEVEVNLSRGMPSFTIVGLPETSVKESRERVETSIRNTGLSFPVKRITVNLAPADTKKEGTALDLPLAVGIIAAAGGINPSLLKDYLAIGELSLDGSLRPVMGILSTTIMAKENGFKGVILPAQNAKEASLIQGMDIYPCETLGETIDFLRGDMEISPYSDDVEDLFKQNADYDVDFSEVKGQELAKRALEIAAAGAHNVIMIGSPGAGKTMLARRMPTILPDLTIEESVETTRIHSIAGILPHNEPIVARRPFRAPHHTISYAGLIGGGSRPSPGEVSLAHNGVLFLDELPEFKRDSLEVLRQPMEDGFVTISRAVSTMTFPSRFMLVGAMNPCPCGYSGDPYHECTCTPGMIERYIGKISGPLLDRIDIHINVSSVRYEDLLTKSDGEPSSKIKQRVLKAREMQGKRYKDEKNIFFNAHLSPKKIKKYCKIGTESEELLKMAVGKFGLSARAFDRILKVSRTIADLNGDDKIKPEYVSEAIQYRTLDRKLWLRL